MVTEYFRSAVIDPVTVYFTRANITFCMDKEPSDVAIL